MCATDLTRIKAPESNTPASIVSQPSIHQEAKVESQGITCPSCNTPNEVGWSFCQQCGGRLPAPDLKTHVDFKTTPTEQAESEPAVAAPAHNPGTPAPPEAAGVLPTVVVERQKQAQASAPASAPKNNKQPPAPPPPTEAATSPSDTMTCTQCGQTNPGGNAFCANCGAQLTVGRTVVMSSPYAPQKGKLHLVMEGGQLGEVYEVNEETVIGRTNGDICFPHDGFMSGRHARIVRRGNAFVLTDEGSRNGTFVKIKSEVELKPGDMILVGKQLFRFEV
jgi:hypothetical protein